MNRKPFVSSVVPENPTPWDPNAVTKLHSPSSLCLSLESSLRSKPGPLDASLHQAVFQELPEAQLAGLVWGSGNGTLCNPCHMAGTVLLTAAAAVQSSPFAQPAPPGKEKNQAPKGGAGKRSEYRTLSFQHLEIPALNPSKHQAKNLRKFAWLTSQRASRPFPDDPFPC